MGLDPKKDAKLFKQVNSDLKELAGLYQKLGEQNPFENLDSSKLDLSQIKDMKEYLRDAREEVDLIFGSFRDVKQEVNEIFSGLNAITDEITKQKQGFNLTKKAVSSLTSVFGSVKDIQDDILNANSADLEKLQDKALAERKNLVEAKRLLELHENITDQTSKEYIALQNVNGILEDNNGLFSDMAQTLEQVVRNEQHVEEITGSLGSAVDGLSEGMKKAGLGAMEQRLGLKDALKSTKDMVTASGGTATKMEAATHLAKGLGKNLMASLGPAALIAIAIDQVVKAFKLIDGKSGEVAKNMGISAAEGRKLVSSSNDIATSSGDLLISTGDVVDAQIKLNTVMGTSVEFPKEMALDFAQISEKAGLSAEAMSHFAAFAVQGKGGIKEQLQDISDTTTELNNQFGVSLNMKNIQEDIGKLSASQRLSAKGNTDELTRQVFLSKMLGLSASQLESVQGSLLDFESSIGAEMEAELLTGKQLNLEGARAAALAGDQAALAAELAKEVGTEAEFMKMNVIQRQAMAKAFGLNVDQMAEMLASQEAMDKMVKATGGKYKTQSEAQAAFNKLIEEGASAEEASAEMKKQGIDDALASQMKSVTQQDKLNAATEKLTDLFFNLMEPLMPVIDTLMDVLDKALKPLMPLLSGIASLLGGVIGPILEVIFMPMQLAVDALKEFGDLFSDLLPEGTKMGDILGDIGKVLGKIIAIGLLPIQFVMRTIINAAQGLFKVFGGIKKMFEGDLLGGLKDVFGGLVDIVISPFQAVFDIIVAGVNLIIDALNFIPGIDIGAIEVPKITSMIGLAEGGIVTSPTVAMIGEGGESEAVIPLSKISSVLPNQQNSQPNSEVAMLLKELISEVRNGGDVYMDGAKVGKSLALATSRMG